MDTLWVKDFFTLGHLFLLIDKGDPLLQFYTKLIQPHEHSFQNEFFLQKKKLINPKIKKWQSR